MASKIKAHVIDRDLGWAATLKAVGQLAVGAYVKVGILGDDERGGLHRQDPETGKSEPLSIAEIAVVNEFGTEDGHIPARPAHRMTFDRMREELQADSGRLIGKIVFDRSITVEDALNVLGLKLATGIKNTITQGPEVPPHNADSTIRAKVPASSTGKKREKAIALARTLVGRTGMTVNAISWAVFPGTVVKAHKFLTKRK